MKWIFCLWALVFQSNGVFAEPTVRLSTMASSMPLTLEGGSSDYKWKPNGGYGLAYALEFGNQRVSVQTGLSAFTFYGDYFTRNNDQAVEINKYQFVAIPVLAKWNLSGDSLRTVYLKAGVQPTFVTYQSHVGANGNAGLTSDDTDKPTYAANLHYSYIVGLGASYPVGEGAAIICDFSWMRSLDSMSRKKYQGLFISGPVYSIGMSFAL